MWTSKQVSLDLKQFQKICSTQAPLSSMFNNPVCGLDFNDVVGWKEGDTKWEERTSFKWRQSVCPSKIITNVVDTRTLSSKYRRII